MSRYLNKIKENVNLHDDIMKMKRFPRHWPSVRGIHRSPVDSPHKSSVRKDMIFSLMLALTRCWQNDRVAGDFRGHDANCDVTLMAYIFPQLYCTLQLLNRFVPWVSFVALTASLSRYIYYRFSTRASHLGGHCYYCDHNPGVLSTIHLKIGIPVDEIYGWPI